MKLIYTILAAFVLSSCGITNQNIQQLAKPGAFLAAKTVISKDDSAETKQKLIKLSDHLVAVASVVDKELTHEEFLAITASFGSGSDWVVFANYLYDIYSAKLSESQLSKVKATAAILVEISKGIKDAVTLSGK